MRSTRNTIFLLSLLAAFGASAQAQTIIRQPGDADIADLDHHYLYTWRLGNIDLTGKTIVAAKLEIDNIRNWDDGTNALHLHLFDTAIKSNANSNNEIRSFLDDNPDEGARVTDLTDDFANTRYHNGKNAKNQNSPWLIASGTADTYLGTYSFTETAVDFTYDFVTQGTSGILLDYFQNGRDIALGFDSDCHFFNDGVKLTIVTAPSNSSSPVPEPATLALLAMGAASVGAVVRRRKA